MSTRTGLDLGIPFAEREGYRRPVQFLVLGSVEVVQEGDGDIALGGPKQRAVLAHLLLRANNLVPTEVLIDEVWGEEPPETVRNTLQTYAARLRKALGPGRLEGSRAGYVLRADPSEVDAHRFQSLLRDARRLLPIDPTAAVAAFDHALSLWRGPAFGDLAGEPSIGAEVARLEELRLGAIEDRIEALLTLGEPGQVIGELETLTARHPLHERFWGQLMLALYREGRQADALAAFQRARGLLADELGIDPSPELRKIHERILQQSPDLDVGGAPLRGYRLLERVGIGGYGTVWRAIQPEVGRDVAVKAIHPHLANEPDFIRRFEAEAQLVARLEHPHVVPLYDYWREPGGAYLVMRFLRGGNLAEALAGGPLETERVVRLLDHVSGALAAAHRQGVVHRDVKPSNILLDEEGHADLADFGIAKDLSANERTETGTIKGSLLYVAPEQLRGEAVTPRTDLYALGIVLFEAIAGTHPFADVPNIALLERQMHEPLPSVLERRPELPPAVDEVIARATAKDPEARFPDASSMAAAFGEALASTVSVAPSQPPLEVRNPYKGLRPFVEADAHDFFGREAFVERLLQRLRREERPARFLAVVGPSGIGKSSAVRAGLVPALRAGAIEGSEGWFITELMPGAHPLEELEAALLRVATQPPAGLLRLLESGPRGLLQAVERIIPEGSELVLVVDQLEEAFTLTEDESERALLLESIRVAAADPASRVRIVATLRADFYDRPLNYPRFGELLGTSTEVVTPLAPDELERAIVKPAEAAGLSVEPALVAQVASDVAEQPGALPLVQYALTELFDHHDEGLLTLAAYRDIGGVGGALAARAEHLYATRQDAGHEAVRQLFLRLVTLGEGVTDTRRRVPLSELSAIEVDAEAMQAALDAFGRHRLLTFDRDPATREPTVEVAHEALLRSWPRLHGWIDAAREDVRMLRKVADAATEWGGSSRDPSFLLTGSRLDQFESWASSTTLAIGNAEREYLRASTARREEEEASEAARAARERGLERRSVKRLRLIVAVLTAAVLVAGTLTAIALDRNASATRASRLATALELAAGAAANLDVDRELAILLALESVRVNDGIALPEAEEILRRTTAVSINTTGLLGGGIQVADFAPEADMVAVAGGDDSVGVWDLSTGLRTFVDASLAPCEAESCPDVLHVSMSDDGATLATMAYPVTPRGFNSFHVWDVADGRETFTVAPTRGLWDRGFVALSPDGGSLATAEWETVQIYPVGVEQPSRTVGWRDATPWILFSPDGTHLFLGDEDPWKDFGPTLVDVSTGETQVLFPGQHTGVPSFSADGSRLALSHRDPAAGGRLTVLDVASGTEVATIPSPEGPVALSPDGTVVAVTSAEPNLDDPSVVTLLEADTLEPIRSLQGDTASLVTGIAFDRSGSQIATASGTVHVWDVRTGAPTFTPPIEASSVLAFEFTQDGSEIVVVYVDGRIIVYPIALDDAIEIARSRVTRSLTDEECQTYLDVPTCPSD